MIRFTVLGGYLGAGKTTLLNHLLHNSAGQRIALLINDFGEINIDAQLVESKTDNQINLANGCVCCSLADGFFEAIERLQQLDPLPDHIVVEASGVADVANLSHYGHSATLQLNGVLVVADAETVQAKANDKYVAQTVRRQLLAADLIVLNKTDLCSDEQLQRVQAWLAEVTEGTPVLTTTRGAIPTAVLFGQMMSTEHEHKSVQGHHSHETYASWSLDVPTRVSFDAATAFVSALGPYVIRAKGLLRCTAGGSIEVQVVGKRKDVQLRPDIDVSRSQLVAIGLQHQFDSETLERLAHERLLED